MVETHFYFCPICQSLVEEANSTMVRFYYGTYDYQAQICPECAEAMMKHNPKTVSRGVIKAGTEMKLPRALAEYLKRHGWVASADDPKPEKGGPGG